MKNLKGSQIVSGSQIDGLFKAIDRLRRQKLKWQNEARRFRRELVEVRRNLIRLGAGQDIDTDLMADCIRITLEGGDASR